ncbi:MAG: hypothetical protein MR646_02880 [Agathobacter sp.]|nr:hypothetical protein [Agathobacter sp.]
MENEIIPLNIVMTYPVRWSRYKIFRDYIQNFFDSVGPHEWKKRFGYNFENGKLCMWVEHTVFSYEWLLHIGASTKTGDMKKKNAGYFGEGFKIASLCALRDFRWNIVMSSGNWKLEVMKLQQDIDSTKVDVLAYDVQSRKSLDESRLELYPVTSEDYQEFLTALNSFYYDGNPLLGEKIWEGEKGAEVVQAFGEVCTQISPEGAVKVLEKMRRYWNSVTGKKIDVGSWAPVIRTLIDRITRSGEAVRSFREKYPFLLYLPPVQSVREKNRRSEAYTWLRQQETPYVTVQVSFEMMGYPSLEEECEKNGGFVQDSNPDPNENRYMEIVEEVVKEIYSDFFRIDGGDMPERKVIANDQASYHGMASLKKRKPPLINERGLKLRNIVCQIYLKKTVFRKTGFYDALATYIHEFCHSFGGDASQSFSFALTLAIEILMENHTVLQKYKERWECV